MRVLRRGASRARIVPDHETQFATFRGMLPAHWTTPITADKWTVFISLPSRLHCFRAARRDAAPCRGGSRLDRRRRRTVISDERQIDVAPDCIEHAAVHRVEAVGLESFLGHWVRGPSFPCANHRDHAVRDAVLHRECCHDAAPFLRVSDRFHNCGSQLRLALTLAHRGAGVLPYLPCQYRARFPPRKM
jgi:hypothetical protein